MTLTEFENLSVKRIAKYRELVDDYAKRKKAHIEANKGGTPPS
jgi:hypothetical protein